MRTAYHHGNLREALLSVAREQLAANPGTELSLRELARLIGVSPHAPYRHFPGKDGVREALAAQGYRELTRAAEEAANTDRPLHVLAHEFARIAAMEPGLLRLTIEHDFTGATADGEAALARDEWFAALVAVVEAAGGKPASTVYRKAAAVWAVLLGVARLRSHGAVGLLEGPLLPDAGELAELVAGVR
ncbi:MAG: TetR/AcrR family transcriptional regulator [Gemmatimonadota bacterium]